LFYTQQGTRVVLRLMALEVGGIQQDLWSSRATADVLGGGGGDAHVVAHLWKRVEAAQQTNAQQAPGGCCTLV
jgi:hypothetical protein